VYKRIFVVTETKQTRAKVN